MLTSNPSVCHFDRNSICGDSKIAIFFFVRNAPM